MYKMGLYKLYSTNVEVQFKSCLLSKAMFFTIFTTVLNLILPFIIAYRSRGFWLKNYSFYEQPYVRFKYEYLLVAETEDPSSPITCGEAPFMHYLREDENCSHFQVQEIDHDGDGKNDLMEFNFEINLQQERSITALNLILLMDFQLKTTCPLQMQSFAIISKEFSFPSSGFSFNADMEFYQITPLTCLRNHVDVKHNVSLFDLYESAQRDLLDGILVDYFNRDVTTQLTNIHTRSYAGKTATFSAHVRIRIPEISVRYKPSFMQELKWAWPQYLSLVIVFYWIFNKIKLYVFNNRLVMAWKVLPWKKH